MAAKIHIEDYLRDNPKLRKPLVAISKDTGYSVTTIHRALRSLQKQHLVKIVKSVRKTEPDTIYYLGSLLMPSPILDRFVANITELTDLATELAAQVVAKQAIIDDLVLQLKQCNNK